MWYSYFSLNKYKIILKILIITGTIISSFACSDGTTTPPEPDHYWGYLTPETKGIYYECGDLSGKTGPEGRFNYKKGEEVKFYLGGVELGTVTGGQVVTPFSLAGHDPVPADLDSALGNDLADYPKARNIMHFLLAINELYDNGNSSYLYEDLVETLESMHLELNGKTLDFSDLAIDDFQAQLNNLSSRRISLGGLNLIDTALITESVQDLDTKVANAQNRPEYLYDYSEIDYTGVSNPPTDGQILSEEQLNGVWIAEWQLYGGDMDYSDINDPDTLYRHEYVEFPQNNYFIRFDGSANNEDFACGQYQTYYSFDISKKEQYRFIKIDGPIVSKQLSSPNYPDSIDYEGGSSLKEDFIGLWKADNDFYSDTTVAGYQLNKYLSYTTNSNYSILTLPRIDDFEDNGTDERRGDFQIIFGKPDQGRVKVYMTVVDDSGNIVIDDNGTRLEMLPLFTLKKIRDDSVDGAQTAFFPID